MAATLASRLLGYVREKAVAHYFGNNWWTDAFYSAFNVPDLIYYLLAGGALGAAFIPILREYFARDDREGGHRVVNSLLNIMLLALLTATTLAALLAPELVRLIARGYNPATDPRYALTVSLTRVLMPQVLIMGLSAVFTALLQCHDNFLWPAVGWVLYNVGFIIGAVWLPHLVGGPPQHQIYGVVLGVLLGAVMLILVMFPSLWRAGYRWRPEIDLSNPDVKRVGRAWLPIMLALAFSQINLLWLPLVLGTYFGNGMVVNIRLAQRLIVLPFGFFAVSIATAAFPTMSTLAFAGRLEELRRTFARSLSSVLFFALPSSAGLIVLALPLTRMMWKGGKFNEAGAVASAQMLGFFAAGLVGLCALQIINRAFFAMREVSVPVRVGALAFLANLGLCVLLMHTGMTYRGIALGTAIGFYVNAVLLIWFLKKKMGRIGGAAIADSFVRSLLATLVMCLVIVLTAEGIARLLGTTVSFSEAFLQVLAGMAVGVPTYLAAAWLLKVPEANIAWQRLSRKLHRQP